MYGKFVRHIMTDKEPPVLADGGDMDVVPREHLMVEGVRFWYRKHRGSSVAAIVDRIDSSTVGAEVLAYDASMDGPDQPDFELIQFVVYDNAGMEVAEIIAPNYQLYVMNNDGDTIDSMCCLVAQPKSADPTEPILAG